MTVNFDVTKQDAEIIHKIAQRAVKMAVEYGVEYDLLTAEMDVTAVHANGNYLKLQSLLDADDFNFAHDIFGIRNHLDRKTGKLKDHFSPRFTDVEFKKGVEREFMKILAKIKKMSEEE